MKHSIILILFFVVIAIIASCSQADSTETNIVYVTPTPEIIVITNTPIPSHTPDLDAPEIWETPPSEVLLNYDPTKDKYLPPPAQFTETVAERVFQFENPLNFKFRNSKYSSAMENKEKTIFAYMEVYDHQGKANSIGYLSVYLSQGGYKLLSKPSQYTLGEFTGWIVDIQSLSEYNPGIGQLIVVDLNKNSLFIAISVTTGDNWESEGKPIFNKILDTLTFPGIT